MNTICLGYIAIIEEQEIYIVGIKRYIEGKGAPTEILYLSGPY